MPTDQDLEYIAEQVKDGYTSGVFGSSMGGRASWAIQINIDNSDHEHNFVDEGARSDSGELIKDCTHEGCYATQDSSGGVIN